MRVIGFRTVLACSLHLCACSALGLFNQDKLNDCDSGTDTSVDGHDTIDVSDLVDEDSSLPDVPSDTSLDPEDDDGDALDVADADMDGISDTVHDPDVDGVDASDMHDLEPDTATEDTIGDPIHEEDVVSDPLSEDAYADVPSDTLCTSVSWSSDTRITSSPSSSNAPRIEWTGSEYGVVWQDDRGGNFNIYFARLSDAGSKRSTDIQLSDAVGDAVTPDIVLSGSNFGIVWDDSRSGNSDILYRGIALDGALITSETPIASMAYPEEDPAIVWSGSELGVVYSGSQAVDFQRVAMDGSLLGTRVEISDGTPENRYYPKIVWSSSEYGVSWLERGTAYLEVFFSRIAPDGILIGSAQMMTYFKNDTWGNSLVWTGSEYGNSFRKYTNYGGPWSHDLFLIRISSVGVKESGNIGISTGSSNSIDPSISWTGSFFGIAWADDRDGAYNIFFNTASPDGSVTSTNIQLTFDANSSRKPETVWSGSSWGLVWEDNRDGDTEIYYKTVLPCS